MKRILLTLPNGRKTLIPVDTIGDIVELDETELCHNEDDDYAYTSVYRTNINKILMVRETIEQIEAILNEVKP